MAATAKAAPRPKAVHADVPVDRAWQVGRRLYVKCGYKSRLNDGLRALGAHWDTEQRALWVGTGKREAVVDLLLIAEACVDRIEDVKAAGRWVAIPYDASNVRAEAKKLGGIWDRDRKEWAMPDAISYQRVRGLRDLWQAARDAEAEARRERDRQARRDAREAERRHEEEAAAKLRARLVETSYRTFTGEIVNLTEVSTQRMRRATAEASARDVGTVVRLDGGRRGLIVSREVRFANGDDASSICWHPETHDEAHWDFRYEILTVELTEAELAEEQRKAAALLDVQEIDALIQQAPQLTNATADDRWTPIRPEDVAGSIEVTTGITGMVRNGTLTLTRDGQVVWQHPGYYDSYIRSEGTSDDPALAARLRAVLDGGPRKRVIRGQVPTYYEIRVGDA